jgi:hypothetical protein
MIDRRHCDVDLSALSPEEAEVVREFAADLRQAREEETERLLLALYKLELFADGMAALCAEQMSPHSPFWREVEQRIGHASFFRPVED